MSSTWPHGDVDKIERTIVAAVIAARALNRALLAVDPNRKAAAETRFTRETMARLNDAYLSDLQCLLAGASSYERPALDRIIAGCMFIKSELRDSGSRSLS